MSLYWYFLENKDTKRLSFIRYILPKLLHKYTKEGILLDVKDKDSMLHVLKCWIPELGELDSTFKRSDISALKAFLSMTEDEIRLRMHVSH
ncbi:VapE domain-containing protein [Bathymodiolus japonicus methanotrophic gill symbiont]|uniref:VapE domain-containing protein n=1 Tax=Bathymodiolus japonicus methanotrophic gill symbiont TaxID=113269 RepID=UPI003B830FD8